VLDSCLEVFSENTVLAAVEAWVRAGEGRKQRLGEIFGSVQTGLLSAGYVGDALAGSHLFCHLGNGFWIEALLQARRSVDATVLAKRPHASAGFNGSLQGVNSVGFEARDGNGSLGSTQATATPSSRGWRSAGRSPSCSCGSRCHSWSRAPCSTPATRCPPR
jgi:hypothetical protein